MFICIIRHGETDWNNSGRIQGREDIPLNNNGIIQIKETLKYFEKYNWNVIITSPSSRAKSSAEIISKGIGNIKIIEEEDFLERDYGEASGLTVEEAKEKFPDGKWPGVESKGELQKRTVNAIEKYIKTFQEENIIIVSHGSAINSIINFYKDDLKNGNVSLRNACITLLEKIDNKIEIKFYNKVVEEL
jgi:uncharacterized phosphatase